MRLLPFSRKPRRRPRVAVHELPAELQKSADFDRRLARIARAPRAKLEELLDREYVKRAASVAAHSEQLAERRLEVAELARADATSAVQEDQARLYGIVADSEEVAEDARRRLEDEERALHREGRYLRTEDDSLSPERWTGLSWFQLGAYSTAAVVAVGTSIYVLQDTLAEHDLVPDLKKAIAYGVGLIATTSLSLSFALRQLKGRFQRWALFSLVGVGVLSAFVAMASLSVTTLDWGALAEGDFGAGDFASLVLGDDASAELSLWWESIPDWLPWSLVQALAFLLLDISLTAICEFKIETLWRRTGGPKWRKRIVNQEWAKQLAVVQAYQDEVSKMFGIVARARRQRKHFDGALSRLCRQAELRLLALFDQAVEKRRRLKKIEDEIRRDLDD